MSRSGGVGDVAVEMKGKEEWRLSFWQVCARRASFMTSKEYCFGRQGYEKIIKY